VIICAFISTESAVLESNVYRHFSPNVTLVVVSYPSSLMDSDRCCVEVSNGVYNETDVIFNTWIYLVHCFMWLS